MSNDREGRLSAKAIDWRWEGEGTLITCEGKYLVQGQISQSLYLYNNREGTIKTYTYKYYFIYDHTASKVKMQIISKNLYKNNKIHVH